MPYQLDGFDLAGSIDGSWIKKFFARRGGKYNEETPRPRWKEVKENKTEKEMKKQWEEE